MYCTNCGVELEKNQHYCSNCGTKNSFENIIDAKNEFRENDVLDNYSYEETFTFLKNATTLEQHKFTLEKTVQKLNKSAQDLQYTESINKETLDPMHNSIGWLVLGFVPTLIIGVIISLLLLKNLFLVVGICLLVLIAISCLSYVYDVIRNIPRKKRDNIRIARSEQAYNERMTKVSEINKEIAKYNSELQEVNMLLSKMYSFNVVHNKYCSLIPIITFYEYFEVGRCNSLKGDRGAYNIFENELRQNTIINKLEDIISRLDLIQQTQYMLYESIQTANRISNEILIQNDRLIESNGNIANNTKAIAYNSKVIADNTRISAYADAFLK